MGGRVQTQQGPGMRQSSGGTEEHRSPPAANTSAWAHTEHSTSQWPRAREWLESHQDAQTKVWTVTGTVFAGHLRQLLSGDAVEQTIRRSVFDAAWSLTCQRSGLHFSDGPHTTLDKGKHLALPLRFWEVATGRKHRAIGPWLRTIGDAEPTRITFATDKGTGQWNVTTGKVTCLLPPGVENTAKPLWSPHEINRLRMMIAHVAIQREGAVALMGKIAVHSSTNYPPNSLTALQGGLPGLLRSPTPPENLAKALAILFYESQQFANRLFADSLLGQPPDQDPPPARLPSPARTADLPIDTRASVITCNIGPRGWFAASQGGIQALVAHRPLLIFIQDARITRTRAASKSFKKQLKWTAPGYKAFISVGHDTKEDGKREYALANVTLVHGAIADRVQNVDVPPELHGRAVATLIDNPLHSSKTLAINVYLPPHDARWRDTWSHIQQTIAEVDRAANSTIQILMGGDFNARPRTEGEHSNRARDAEFATHCATSKLTLIRPAATRSRPISYQSWSNATAPGVQGSLLDHFLIRMSNQTGLTWRSASATIGPRPLASHGDMDHFPIHLRTGSALLPPPPPNIHNKRPRRRLDMSTWATHREAWSETVTTALSSKTAQLLHAPSPVSFWSEQLGPLLVREAGRVAGWKTLGAQRRAPFCCSRQRHLRAELRAITTAQRHILDATRSRMAEDTVTPPLPADVTKLLEGSNRSTEWVTPSATSLPTAEPLRGPQPGENLASFCTLLRKGEAQRKQMLAGLRHAQIGKNLQDAKTRLHSLFPARGTVKQALGRVEPKAPLQCLESRHPNLILIAPSTPGKRIQDQLQAWLHETGERSFQENDVDQLPLWMRVQDIEAAVHAMAGTSEAVILEQITDEGSLLILREPILLARLMTWLDQEDREGDLRNAILRIGTSQTPDRVVTSSAMLSAWEYHIAKGAQSTDLVCDQCGEQPEPVTMTRSTAAARSMAHLCTRCRRLIHPVERSRTELPANMRPCLDKHPRRCDEHSPEYQPLRGALSREALDGLLRKLKRNKAPGGDHVTAELLRDLPDSAKPSLLALVNAVLEGHPIPSQWKVGEVSLLHKGPEKAPWEAASYRPVTLLSVVYKLCEAAINERLTHNIETFELLEPNQEGFRRGRGTRRALIGITWKLQHLRRTANKAILVALDFSSAFDRVRLPALWEALEGYGFAAADIELLRNFYGGAKVRAATDLGYTAEIPCTRGTRQGALLSPNFFNLMLNVLLRHIAHNAPAANDETTNALRSPVSGYADDLTIVTGRVKEAQSIITECVLFSDWSGLQLNPKKCQASAYNFATHQGFQPSLKVGEHPISANATADALKILGAWVSPALDWKKQKTEMLRRQTEITREIMNARLSPHHMNLLQGMSQQAHFRYAGALCLWTHTEITKLRRLWRSARNFGQGLRARSASRVLATLGHRHGGWAGIDPAVVLFQELDSSVRQVTRYDDPMRRAFLADAAKLLPALGVTTLRQAAHELRDRPHQALQEDSLTAQLVSAAALLGLIPKTALIPANRPTNQPQTESATAGNYIRPILGTQVREESLQRTLDWCITHGFDTVSSLRREERWTFPPLLPATLRKPLQCIQNKLTEALHTLQSMIPKGPTGIMGWIRGRGTKDPSASPHETQIQIKGRTQDRFYKDPAARDIWHARAQCFTNLRRSNATDTWTAQLRNQTKLLTAVQQLLDPRPANGDIRRKRAEQIEDMFKKHNGFLLQPAQWWPGWNHKEDFPFWIALPRAAGTPPRDRKRDFDFDMQGICAWSNQVHCKTCDECKSEWDMLQGACSCAINKTTWATIRTDNACSWKQLKEAVETTLAEGMRSLSDRAETFGLLPADATSPEGHPACRRRETATISRPGSQTMRLTPANHHPTMKSKRLRRLAEFCQTLNSTQGTTTEVLAMHTHALTEAGRTGATLAYNTLSEDTEGRGTEKDLTRKQAHTAARRTWDDQQFRLLSNKDSPNFSERWMLTPGAGRGYLQEVWKEKHASTTRLLTRAITFNLPLQVNLHRWAPQKHLSSLCPLCNQEPETFTHFSSVCTKLHDIRTKAAQTFSRGLLSALDHELPTEWQTFIETPASTAFPQLLGTTLARLQPDGFAINTESRRCVIIECARRADTKLCDDHHDEFNDGAHNALQLLLDKAEEKRDKYEELAAEIRRQGFNVQVTAFVIGMKLSFSEEEWKAQLRELIPAEKSIERIIKRAIRAGARATLQCWEARGGALARRHTAAIDARPRGGGPSNALHDDGLTKTHDDSLTKPHEIYAITSSTDDTGPRNPHRPFRNPLTHPHGPNAMRIPLPPQPHPREQPNETSDELALTVTDSIPVRLGISKLYKLTPNSAFTPLLGR